MYFFQVLPSFAAAELCFFLSASTCCRNASSRLRCSSASRCCCWRIAAAFAAAAAAFSVSCRWYATSPPMTVRAARIASRMFVLISFSMGPPLREIGLPSAALIGSTGVVDGTLLLNKDCCIHVFYGSIAPFHIGDGHLSGEAGMQRALGLHLA